jgi:hypothetical protein
MLETKVAVMLVEDKEDIPCEPAVASIFGTALETTKLNNHCVIAAIDTLKARRRALGISAT